MTKLARKTVKALLITLTILIVGGFALNWFLTYRLQSYLKEYLGEEVSKATDGFYQFSFDDLSVGLFNGELSIRGIELKPDSITYAQWDKGDSLPATYFNIHVGEIHFRGVNLTWRRDYKYLNFKLFEIKSPDIKIFAPITSDTVKDKSVRAPQTLHDMISPFIDVVSAKDINVTNMNVSYTISDSISPVIYTLKDADFHAYGFLLNRKSAISGKLLYCNDFEFIADKPQVLLYSDEMVLNTSSIKLSTIDSFIQIRNVKLAPRDNFWDDRIQYEGKYLKAEIAAVDVKGAGFERKEALNYLNARSFDIAYTDIQYHSVKEGKDADKKKKQSPDSTLIDPDWSLYEIISPLLQSIAIEKIGIENTKLRYANTQDGNSDIYTLDQFDFHANKFLVNPYSEKEKKFWYVDDFTMEGNKINGHIESNNANVEVDRFLLSTTDKRFEVSDINIEPISTGNRKDYLKGKIARIYIDDLDYDTGISAGNINIDTVSIEYTKVSAAKQDKGKKQSANPDDVFNFMRPYANHVSVKQIRLKDADIAINNRTDNTSYQLNDFNFFASDFLINDHTRRASKYIFTYDDIGFSFRNFDNLLPGKQYRLKIKNADMSTLTGKFRLEDVRLIPQTASWKNVPNTYFDISIPLIDIAGFDNDRFISNQVAAISSLQISNPHIKMVKTRNGDKGNSGNDNSTLANEIKAIIIGKSNIKDLHLTYLDKTTSDSLQTSLSSFSLSALEWEVNNKLSIGKIGLANGAFDLRQPDMELNGTLASFDMLKLIWNDKTLLDIAGVNIRKPELNIYQQFYSPEKEKPKDDSTSSDFYSTLQDFVMKLSIHKLDINEANINYAHSLNDVEVKHQKLNRTNLDISGLTVDARKKSYDIKDFKFNTKDLSFPISNGFYTLHIGEIDANKQAGTLKIVNSRMVSIYPQWEFAHFHPTHKDWFDVSAGNVTLSGLDYPAFFRQNTVKAKHLQVDNVMLQNFKNTQIEIQHNVMPLIYEGLYKLPAKLAIDTANVFNFSVIYEELAKKASVPGAINFIGMNALLSGVTNIISHPNQYIRLDVDGSFMNRGYFNARWDIPVDPDNDCFILEGRIPYFDLWDLNRTITPLASAEVKTGILNDFWFRTEASSEDAMVDLRFLYNDLNINILKRNEEESPNKFMSGLANLIIRSNNPNKPGGKPRTSHLTIKRDPEHSTFNYFWQILQPPLVESVGVSQGTQNFAKKAGGFFTKVKNFFTGGGKDKDKNNKED